MSFSIPTPKEFSFTEALHFLKRSPKEILHRVEGDRVTKLLLILGQPVLIQITEAEEGLEIKFLNTKPSKKVKDQVAKYVTEWFDLQTNLKPFYTLARKDELLKNLVKKYYGYRIIGQPNLFESLVWAVLGQQINLSFAYTLKQRFVEQFGEKLNWKDVHYYNFPTPQIVASLTDDDLLPLQFSRQKSKYVVLIAQAFANAEVSKSSIAVLPFQEAKEKLMTIKGVGNWTANYALMKTFLYAEAFPLEDAGLHNALKNQLGLATKPNLDQVKKIFKRYKGWEAYATLYFWRSLR
jgi:DNA-3-methyladenine glycosylase II